MTEHALLSASSSHRWLTCPPLPQLERFFENKTSEVAQEGTVAHALSEYKVLALLGKKAQRPQSPLIDQEMEDLTDEYVSYIRELLKSVKEKTSDPLILVEQRLDFSRYVPEGFGTGDCLIVADEVLHIIDFKYGRGVLVEAKNNPQMMCYALGALELFETLYDIRKVSMTIFQPRKYNLSSATMTVEDLTKWAEKELTPKAELAFKGEGTVTYGPWCQFSNCHTLIRARKDYHDQLTRFQLCSPHLLTDAEIEEVLEHVDDLVKWATEVKDYATELVLKTDKEWRNFKLVEGRSVRKFTDEEKVAKVCKENGYTDIYKKQLISLTELQKLMGKENFNQLLGGLIYKPKGKPTLVPQSDKRKELVLHDIHKEFGGN